MRKDKEPQATLYIRLPAALKRQIEKFAAKQEVSVNRMINRWLTMLSRGDME